MKTTFYFKSLAKSDEEKFVDYLTKKISRLTRLLEDKDLKIADLKANIEYFQKHTAFAVKLDLKIGKEELIGEERSHDVSKGIDLAIDRLISQLRKVESKKHDK